MNRRKMMEKRMKDFFLIKYCNDNFIPKIKKSIQFKHFNRMIYHKYVGEVAKWRDVNNFILVISKR